MTALITNPQRPDVDGAVAKLAAGHWMACPYEAYGQLDRGEWNAEFVSYLAEYDIRADVIDIPKRSVAVIFNIDAQPTFEQVVESITAIDHQRAVDHP